jgi:NAD(P)-dependent dehydrogenase (short-subunit alcohol dehydrogenase family)
MNRLSGKTALVTGGGNGLGRGIVEHMAKEGAKVVLLEVNAEWARQTEAELAARGLDVIGLAGDVTIEADVQRAVDRCIGTSGGLHILCNNAGVAMPGPVELVDLPRSEWQRLIDVNLTGPFLTTKAAAPVLRDSGGGSIINVTSISARLCYPGAGAYAASKSALETLTRQCAVELGPWKIRVNSMSLGWFRSALNEYVYQAPGVLERRSAMIPLGRVGSVEDSAKLAVFLASDESNYITGESIESDGGLLAAGLKYAVELARR